jgi:hypothetical protein
MQATNEKLALASDTSMSSERKAAAGIVDGSQFNAEATDVSALDSINNVEDRSVVSTPAGTTARIGAWATPTPRASPLAGVDTATGVATDATVVLTASAAVAPDVGPATAPAATVALLRRWICTWTPPAAMTGSTRRTGGDTRTGPMPGTLTSGPGCCTCGVTTTAASSRAAEKLRRVLGWRRAGETGVRSVATSRIKLPSAPPAMSKRLAMGPFSRNARRSEGCTVDPGSALASICPRTVRAWPGSLMRAWVAPVTASRCSSGSVRRCLVSIAVSTSR